MKVRFFPLLPIFSPVAQWLEHIAYNGTILVRFQTGLLICIGSLSGQSARPLTLEMGDRGPPGTPNIFVDQNNKKMYNILEKVEK